VKSPKVQFVDEIIEYSSTAGRKSFPGDRARESTERVDTRMLQVLYSVYADKLPVYVEQQMDVFVDAQRQAEKK